MLYCNYAAVKERQLRRSWWCSIFCQTPFSKNDWAHLHQYSNRLLVISPLGRVHLQRARIKGLHIEVIPEPRDRWVNISEGAHTFRKLWTNEVTPHEGVRALELDWPISTGGTGLFTHSNFRGRREKETSGVQRLLEARRWPWCWIRPPIPTPHHTPAHAEQRTVQSTHADREHRRPRGVASHHRNLDALLRTCAVGHKCRLN